MPTISYREGLLERLAEPEYAALYLKTAMDELMEDSDWDAFMLALSNVCDARERAGMANVPFQELKALQQADHGVDLVTLSKILAQVGITFDLKPMNMPVVA